MSAYRSRRVAALLSIGALSAGSAVAAAPAQAGLLSGLLPNLGTIITQTGQTLGSLVPGLGGVLTGVTGTVGGVVGGVQNTVVGLLDQTLGGALGGQTSLLPTGVVDTLVGTLLTNSLAAPGSPGTAKSGEPIVLRGGTIGASGVVLDASAPRPTVTVLSKLSQIGRDGKMRVEIRSDEPGIIAVAGTLRPGAPVKSKKGASAARHSRKVIKVPQIVLAYRKAGKLVATVHLSRSAQRALGSSKDAKMSVGTVAVDVFKNQDSDSARVNIKR